MVNPLVFVRKIQECMKLKIGLTQNKVWCCVLYYIYSEDCSAELIQSCPSLLQPALIDCWSGQDCYLYSLAGLRGTHLSSPVDNVATFLPVMGGHRLNLWRNLIPPTGFLSHDTTNYCIHSVWNQISFFHYLLLKWEFLWIQMFNISCENLR